VCWALCLSPHTAGTRRAEVPIFISRRAQGANCMAGLIGVIAGHCATKTRKKPLRSKAVAPSMQLRLNGAASTAGELFNHFPLISALFADRLLCTMLANRASRAISGRRVGASTQKVASAKCCIHRPAHRASAVHVAAFFNFFGGSSSGGSSAKAAELVENLQGLLASGRPSSTDVESLVRRACGHI
jgi:hypothetical protein